MNREIEFRCFYDNQMHRVTSIDFSYKTINLTGADIIKFKDGILMQYTGLKDKNGKKIFEGDILRYREYLSDGTYIDSYDIVFYNMDYGTFEVKFNSNNDDTEILGLYLSRINNEYADYEVIGNIYEKEGK